MASREGVRSVALALPGTVEEPGFRFEDGEVESQTGEGSVARVPSG